MSTDFNVLDFGAKGDGQTNDAAAIQSAITKAAGNGGGRIIFPAGRTFLSGTLKLESNLIVHLEPGATLLASPRPEDHLISLRNKPSRAFITAQNKSDIAFTGTGTIDGNGRAYVANDLGYIFTMCEGRPNTFFLLGCQHVSFRDITVRDGASWTVRLSGCDDVVINGIRLFNSLKVPNSDAIDIDRCRNVRISDCHIESGDDCIVLKALKDTEGFGVCENIVVRGCTLVSTSSALIIGCEAHAVLRDVIFDSCIIRRSHRGLAIHLSEQCDVENILFSNMIVETRVFHPKWWGRGEPIYVTAIPWTSTSGIGQVRNVRFVNILCRSEAGVFVQGWTADRIDGLLLENVRVEIDKWSDVPGGEFDIRPYPSDEGGSGPVGSGVFPHPISGFYLKNATNVILRNCETTWGASKQDYFRYALESDNVIGLTLENFKGQSADPKKWEAIVRRDA